MRKHTRETDLTYFNGDTLILNSGKRWLVIRLNQPVKPQRHYYTVVNAERTRQCKVGDNDIDHTKTEELHKAHNIV